MRIFETVYEAQLLAMEGEQQIAREVARWIASTVKSSFRKLTGRDPQV